LNKRVDLFWATLGEGDLILTLAGIGWITKQPLIFASLVPTAYELVEQPELNGRTCCWSRTAHSQQRLLSPHHAEPDRREFRGPRTGKIARLAGLTLASSVRYRDVRKTRRVLSPVDLD
jgi:hypothetical protein